MFALSINFILILLGLFLFLSALFFTLYYFYRKKKIQLIHWYMEREVLPPKSLTLFVKRRKKLLIRFIEQYGFLFIERFSLPSHLLKMVEKNKNFIYPYALSYLLESGGKLFLEKAFKSKKRKETLRLYLETQEHTALYRFGSQTEAQRFDTEELYSLFEPHKEWFNTYLSHQEWEVRFFLYQITLLSKSVEEGFLDEQPEIREFLVKEAPVDLNPNLKSILYSLITDDPNLQVRRAAKARFMLEFSGDYNYNLEKLTPKQSLYLAETFWTTINSDVQHATELLLSDNDSLSLKATKFLSKTELPREWLRSADWDDKTSFELYQKRLTTMALWGHSSFLSLIKLKQVSKGMLLMASRILKEIDEKKLISVLAKNVFQFDNFLNDVETKTLMREALDLINSKGDSNSLELMYEVALHKMNNKNTDELTFFIEALTEETGIYAGELIKKIVTDDIAVKESLLVEVCKKITVSTGIYPLIEILREDNKTYTNKARRLALRLLLHNPKRDYIPVLFEYLPLLQKEDIDVALPLIETYPEDLVISEYKFLYSTNDTLIQRSVLALLPSFAFEEFREELELAFKSPNPLLRWGAFASKLAQDKIYITELQKAVYDVAPYVARRAVQTLALVPQRRVWTTFRKNLTEEEIHPSVKEEIITTLGKSDDTFALEILLENLDYEKDNSIYLAPLVYRNSPSDWKIIFNFYLEGETWFKEELKTWYKIHFFELDPSIFSIFSATELSIENKKALGEFFEVIGAVSYLGSKLSDRNVEVRKDSIEKLMLLDTKSAYGAVLTALGDPEPSIREQVILSLKNLDTIQTIATLKELQKDPDKMVRRYATWALEKNLLR